MLQKRPLLVAALAASLASSASAALIAYDNFDSYTAGALAGQAGGTYTAGNLVGNTASQTGWDDGWKVIGANASLVVAASPSGMSGDKAALDNSGSSMQATRQWYNPATDFADGTVIWASVQIRNNSGTDTLFGLFQQSGQASNFGVATKNTGTNTMQVGVRLAGTSVYAANGTSVTGTGPTVDISSGKFATVFLKYTLSTTSLGDRLDVYVNPSSDPGSNAGDISIGASFFNFHVQSGGTQGTGHLLAAGFSSGQAAYDEIRIGTTFADVSAIPEPSSFAALAGLGVLGLVASRRRRQA